MTGFIRIGKQSNLSFNSKTIVNKGFQGVIDTINLVYMKKTPKTDVSRL
ncbi:MAG: hypothetical protein OXJ52_00455 [Oligoflexia bacterium]|nr:hypothetical protein [Oligoflexia bacterium]